MDRAPLSSPLLLSAQGRISAARWVETTQRETRVRPTLLVSRDAASQVSQERDQHRLCSNVVWLDAAVAGSDATYTARQECSTTASLLGSASQVVGLPQRFAAWVAPLGCLQARILLCCLAWPASVSAFDVPETFLGSSHNLITIDCRPRGFGSRPFPFSIEERVKGEQGSGCHGGSTIW